ncbi:MAG: sulfatase [Candidatus Nealsonbacteria bacterium]|nr:sulfatase [Candidatus Nealsonbacteria bacterium]
MAVVVALIGATSTAAEKPNIVFFLIDDLGWMDLSCQGNKLIDSPNIDKLAGQGMRFTDAYAAAPVCSPTRAAIATGQSPARLHITNHISRKPFLREDSKLLPAERLDHLALEHVTIAERLKAAGYATAFMGKWHLAQSGLGNPEFYPEHQGFDVNLGGCGYGGPPGYFAPYRIHNLQSKTDDEHLPDRFADEAISFIRTNRDGPFMLFLWHYTVHWPVEAPEHLLKKYEKRSGLGLKDHRYGAMVEAMDAAVGRVLAALDELKLTERTLVVFTSDNGAYGGVADNRPLRAAKGHLYEGGIRVPAIVRLPGVVRPGTLCREPIISTDFFPTLLAAAGLKPDADVPADGENLLPLLKQTGPLKRSAIHFHYPNFAFHRDNRLGGAIRQGDYKLIEFYEDDSVELYNLANDIGETRDLSAEMPEKAAEMKGKLDAWLKESGAKMPRPR